jgi:DNA-directed RNA polymerase subunit A'
MSVVEVTKPGTFSGGVPIRGGLNDPALGAADPRSTCATCKNTYVGSGKINECPGHFGHIEVRPPRRAAGRHAGSAGASC